MEIESALTFAISAAEVAAEELEKEGRDADRCIALAHAGATLAVAQQLDKLVRATLDQREAPNYGWKVEPTWRSERRPRGDGGGRLVRELEMLTAYPVPPSRRDDDG
jgi:hypothetical protein